MARARRNESWKNDLGPELLRLRESYARLTFRELSIVVSGMVDAGLAELLSERLAGEQAQTDRFLGLDGGSNAPAGSFAARTRLAVMVGLISESQASTLDALRAIRNRMAHSVLPTYADDTIQSHLRRLFETVGAQMVKAGIDAAALGTYDGTEDDARNVLMLALVMSEALFTVLFEQMLPIPQLPDQKLTSDGARAHRLLESRVIARAFVDEFPELRPVPIAEIEAKLRRLEAAAGDEDPSSPESIERLLAEFPEFRKRQPDEVFGKFQRIHDAFAFADDDATEPSSPERK